jgi:hypothetical protein
LEVADVAGPGLLGSALLALWGNAAAEAEAEFNDWYTHEHLPERIAIPGFLRARRYVSVTEDARTAGWTYFTMYETEGLDTLRSPAYLHALEHPTPGTRRYLPYFQGMSRTACRVTASHARHAAGGTLGGAAGLTEFAPRPGAADGLRDWITGELAPSLLRRPQYLAVHLAEADPEATGAGSQTASYDDTPTTAGRWVLIVEGSWSDLGEALETQLRDVQELERHGAAADHAHDLFRLLCSLTGGTDV